jgi:phage gp45-like
LLTQDCCLNGTSVIQFNDASQNIGAPSATVLDINATDEIELNATLVDVNANLDVSGTYTGAGTMTTGGNIIIPNAGNIGSVGDTDSIAIASNGVVTHLLLLLQFPIALQTRTSL